MINTQDKICLILISIACCKTKQFLIRKKQVPSQSPKRLWKKMSVGIKSI